MGHQHEIRLSIRRWEPSNTRHCQRFSDHIGHESHYGECWLTFYCFSVGAASFNHRLFRFLSFYFLRRILILILFLLFLPSLQRQINVKSKFDIINLTNRKFNGDNVLSIHILGYQCSNDLRYVLFTHNVKYVSFLDGDGFCYL